MLDRLLPVPRVSYGEDFHVNQEDWGWFAWFDKSDAKLALDIRTDDHEMVQIDRCFLRVAG